jgi:hypothetical protein
MSPTPPVPPPSPVPSPTQTVVVNLPPDVVNKLSPHESGLPQSWATIVAASIAVAAALLAFWSVSRQINAAAREGQKNRTTDTQIAKRNRATDVHAARQALLVERMAEAITGHRLLEDLIRANHAKPLRDWEEGERNAFSQETQTMRAISSMLRVLGAGSSSGALWKLTYQMNINANEGRANPVVGPTQKLVTAMLTAFHDDLSPGEDIEPPSPDEADVSSQTK